MCIVYFHQKNGIPFHDPCLLHQLFCLSLSNIHVKNVHRHLHGQEFTHPEMIYNDLLRKWVDKFGEKNNSREEPSKP